MIGIFDFTEQLSLTGLLSLFGQIDYRATELFEYFLLLSFKSL